MNFDNKDEGCNGWCIFKPETLVGEAPVNYHVVEVKIKKEGDKIVSILRNTKGETLCHKYKVKDGTQPAVKTFEDAIALRSELARLQNDGTKVCGNCAGRCYSDFKCDNEPVS